MGSFVCRECHTEFESFTHNAVFCSKQCKWKFHNRKKALKVKADSGDRKAIFELAKMNGTLEHCPRMCANMLDLPCGRNPICWGGKPCEKATSKGVKGFKNGGLRRDEYL